MFNVFKALKCLSQTRFIRFWFLIKIREISERYLLFYLMHSQQQQSKGYFRAGVLNRFKVGNPFSKEPYNSLSFSLFR